MALAIPASVGPITVSSRERSGDLSHGMSPKVFGFIGDKKFMIKSDNDKANRSTGAGALAERFVYVLLEKIAHGFLQTNTVQIVPSSLYFPEDTLTKWATVHGWMDGYLMRDNFSFSCILSSIQESQYDAMSILDSIVYNQDRHGSNWGFMGDDLVPIDHGLCLPWSDEALYLIHSAENAVKNLSGTCNVSRIVSNFLSLEATDFLEMLDDIPHEMHTLFAKRIVTRMMRMQTVIRVHLPKLHVDSR